MQGFLFFIGAIVGLFLSFVIDKDDLVTNKDMPKVVFIVLFFIGAILCLAGHYEGWWLPSE